MSETDYTLFLVIASIFFGICMTALISYVMEKSK